MKLKDLLHAFSYDAYRSTDKVVKFTRDKQMADPILFYEQIAALLHLRPYFFGVIVIILASIGALLPWWENPEVWKITINILTPEKRVLSHVLYCFASLIFFYSLSVIKDAYFQTLQAVKALVPIEKYDELKRKLCRDSVTYLALSLMLCGFILQLCYEFYLGYKLGFWSENIPIWSGLRYGPISFLFMGVPVILGFFFFCGHHQ